MDASKHGVPVTYGYPTFAHYDTTASQSADSKLADSKLAGSKLTGSDLRIPGAKFDPEDLEESVEGIIAFMKGKEQLA